MRSHHRWLVYLSTTAALLIVFVLVPAAEGSDLDEATAQIRKASNSYLKALSRGNRDGIASFWTPEGIFADASGNTYQAQTLVQQEFSKEVSPQDERTVTKQQTTIRLITPTVAIEQSNAIQEPSDETSSPNNSKFIAIWVKANDRWLLDYLKELSVPSTLQQAGPLDELSWMVGHWDYQADGIRAHLSVDWSDQRQFLIQKFTVQRPGQDDLRGEQRIGWDPSRKQVRSWLFRSDGGFVEGVWSREKDTWVVEKVGVTPDGKKTATVNLWVYEDPDNCWFKSLNAKVGNREIEDIILQFRRIDSP